MSMAIRTLLAVLAAFVVTASALWLFRGKLPQDHGRAFAVNGEKSKGKARGGGVLFIPAFAVLTLIFVPFSTELCLYLVLTVLAMVTGYLDDKSALPWSELKKGLLDLAICAAAVVVFMLNEHAASISLFSLKIVLPKWLFALFATFLLWGCINCCNCSDGVDGLFGTLGMLALGAVSYVLYTAFAKSDYALSGLILICTLAAYLLFNASPSLIMMGDAGSRAVGLFLAILTLKTGNMLLIFPFAIVILLDGGLGLIKLSIMRLTHSKTFMMWLLTPLHDEVRKKRGWSDTQTVFRFALIQLIFCLIGIVSLSL